MPELPEVETIARGLAPQVEGRRITAVSILNDSSVAGNRARLEADLPGCLVDRVGRRGKLLLMELTPETATAQPIQTGTGLPSHLAFHLKMSGRLFVYPQGTPPERHTRIALDLSDGNRLFFDDTRKFGFCRVLCPEDFANWPFWQTLGPEPLTIAKTPFVALFHGRRTRIKAALLDQTVIAGIGNIYADESLFRARIRPDAPCNTLSAAQLGTLHTVLREVLEQAIRECGSSIRDYRDAHGDAGAFQNRFLAYGRSGMPCTICGTPMLTTKVAGRTTVFCAHCQTAGS